MRIGFIAILTCLLGGCASDKQYAGSALEIPTAPEGAPSQIWQVTKSKVGSVISSVAHENGMRVWNVSLSKVHSSFVTYDGKGISILFFYTDAINPMTIEITELGVSHPTRVHREIMREIRDRLERAGVDARPTYPRTSVLF